MALAAATPAAGDTFYLDTSAVIPLALDHGAGTGVAQEPVEQVRAARVKAFLPDAQRVGKVVTSLLSLQELAGVYRNAMRHELAKKTPHGTWKNLRAMDKTAAAAVDGQAFTVMVTMFTLARDALKALLIPIEAPPVPSAGLAAACQKMRTSYEKILTNHQAIDPMDALHITFGTHMGAVHFVSFDQGWETVASITVYN